MNDIFTVNHGEQLASIILEVNRRYVDALARVARDYQVEPGCVSVPMIAIYERWDREIAVACRDMMAHMSRTVAEFQRIASDAVAAMQFSIKIENSSCTSK